MLFFFYLGHSNSFSFFPSALLGMYLVFLEFLMIFFYVLMQETLLF